MKKLIKPKRLKLGDSVGLIAPGSAVTSLQLQETVTKIEKLGFHVILGKHIEKKNGFLAGNDQERVFDIMQMFENQEVDAIFCIRGGYGCLRILPFLNYEVISRHPKIFIGYSDVTALLQSIYKFSNLVTFHAPLGVSSFNEYTFSQFQKVLMSETKNLELKNSENIEVSPYFINEGICDGILSGGNLAVLTSLLSTTFEPNLRNKLLFIEDIGEAPYRIDRMLTQWLLSENFRHLKGIILGIFKNCDINNDDVTSENSFSLAQVLEERLKNLNIPIFYGFSFGHISEICTLPLGIKCRLDSKNQKITLLENSVL